MLPSFICDGICTQSSSTPKTVGKPTARAASAKRTTPYNPLRSVMANAFNPNEAATSANSSGCAAPSKNEKLERQCNSAYGTTDTARDTSDSKGCRLAPSAGPSPPPFQATDDGARPLERRASNSLHGMAGLVNPIGREYRTYVRIGSGYFKPSKALAACKPPKRPISAMASASCQANHATCWLSPSGGAGATSADRMR